MEENIKYCSSAKHKEIKAISFCENCRIYMCNKCDNYHKENFPNHNIIKCEKENENIGEIFTGLCNINNHLCELLYFCKDHNILCCAKCITKIKGKENGQHSDCNIYLIEDIEQQKINKLKDNIKILEDLSTNFEKSIIRIKEIYENIEKDKDEIKLNIQKIFTKIRNQLNETEDKMMLEVDNKFDKIISNKNIFKNKEKFNYNIKELIKKGKSIQENKNNYNLNFLLNVCLNIENNIKEINIINEDIKNIDSSKVEYKFDPNENAINAILDKINKINFLKEGSNLLGKLLNDKDVELIANWIKSDNNQIKDIKFSLCYDAKTNGDDKNSFHKFCDNIGPSLLVIKTKSNYIFGGYTKENWENVNNTNYKDDNTAFLFSINNKEKIKVKNSKRAIVNDSNYGPVFGHGNAYEICLFYPFLSHDVQICDDGDYGGKKNLILVGNSNKRPVEIEVYKVKIKI